ncbi:pentatricopeptide repeat-containing protein [Canna indica]|uniref:Pentatricopeptide repeat-containing protein n=1 Tax=Canna indica TaxID=4628 RepID=A0AAQ3KIZ1_9LILI|nr:pentatricopeptide repeat-containing protein [Canna indica]
MTRIQAGKMVAAKSDLPRSPLPIASSTAMPYPPPVWEAPPSQLPSTSIPDPRVGAFCEILSRVPPAELESVLSRCGISPLPEHVEAVLRLCYASPDSAISFFRWTGRSLKHTPYAWNLMVDILGKNGQFETMWDAIRSMKQEGALSTATFFSAFGSYCAAGRLKEAIMTFDVMDRYGISKDVVAVNSLLSAICREDGRTSDAADFFDRVKINIPPDADTFAILLEGWEKEGNVARAKNTFGEMVIRVGWNADNMSAYDAFLTTLVRGSQPDEAVKFLKVMQAKNCLPGLKFFSNALDILIQQNNHLHALALWDIMVIDSGLIPNLAMCNAMIVVLCNNRDLDSAYRLLDEMPCFGVFPDTFTYNTIFGCLIRNKKAQEAERFFVEMRKSEQWPSPKNCEIAIRMFFDHYDPRAAMEVWNFMVEDLSPDDECANELLLGLLELGRLTEVRRHAEDMLNRGIQFPSSTLEKLKTAFHKAGRQDAYDRIVRRLKKH